MAGVTTRRTVAAGDSRPYTNDSRLVTAASTAMRGGDSRLYTEESLRGRFRFIRWNHPSAHPRSFP